MNLSPASSIAARLASESIPASATTVTSGKPVRGGERLDHRQDRLGLGGVALERVDHQREPAHIGQQPDGDLRLQAAFLGEPGLAEPVTLVGLEVQRGDVVEHQRRRPQPDMRRAGCREGIAPLRRSHRPAAAG